MDREADLINCKLNGPGLQETLGIVVEAEITEEGSRMFSYLNADNEGRSKGRWCGGKCKTVKAQQGFGIRMRISPRIASDILSFAAISTSSLAHSPFHAHPIRR